VGTVWRHFDGAAAACGAGAEIGGAEALGSSQLRMSAMVQRKIYNFRVVSFFIRGHLQNLNFKFKKFKRNFGSLNYFFKKKM
jgi:hypothetical protein